MSLITGYMPHTATLSQSGGINDYGEPITTDTDISCRFEPNNQLISDASGREIMSQAMVFTETEVKLQDSLTFESQKFPVKRVDKMYELSGAFSHYEVYL